MPRKKKIEWTTDVVRFDEQDYTTVTSSKSSSIGVHWVDNKFDVSACVNLEDNTTYVKQTYCTSKPQVTVHSMFQSVPLTCMSMDIEGLTTIKDIVLKEDGTAISMTYGGNYCLFLNPPYADKEKKISKHDRGYLVQYYGSHPAAGYSYLYDHHGKELGNCFDVETYRLGCVEM